jgi:valyl-tRNA synthetase
MSFYNNLVKLSSSDTGRTIYVHPREVSCVTPNEVFHEVFPSNSVVHTRQGQMLLVVGTSDAVVEALFPSKSYYDRYEEEKTKTQRMSKEIEAMRAYNLRLESDNKNYVKMFEQTAKTEGELRDELNRFKSIHSGQRLNIERLQGEARQHESSMMEVSQEAYDLREALNKMRLERDSLYRRWQATEQEVVNLKHDMKQHVCPAPMGDRSNSAHWQQKYNEAMENYTRVSKDYDVITARLNDVLKEKTELEQRLNSLILNPCVIISLN